MRGAVRRRDPEVAGRFRKDPADEAFLARLNDRLAPFEEEEARDLEERLPTLHVIGVPRSGTTLLSQLVASCLDVGYVNNLIAAFWRAPVHGIRLSKKVLPSPPPSSFRSEYGRTRGIAEPHEFGYFWSELLGYAEPAEKTEDEEERIDWSRVRRVLLNMTEAFGRPVAFKSFYLGWHVARVQRELPRTCFVRVRREPVSNALSLLRMRREFLGSEERWASLRPREYEWLRDRPVTEQVAGQVCFLDRSLTRQIRRAGGRNVLEVGYDELCSDPRAVLERVRGLLERNGAEVEWTADPPESFPYRPADPSRPRFAEVQAAVRRFAPDPDPVS